MKIERGGGKMIFKNEKRPNFEIQNSGGVIICGHATTAYILNREGLASPVIEKNGFQSFDGLPDPNLSRGLDLTPVSVAAT